MRFIYSTLNIICHSENSKSEIMGYPYMYINKIKYMYVKCRSAASTLFLTSGPFY